MAIVGILLCDITEEAKLHWDALPGNPSGKFTYHFPVIREIIRGATEQTIIDSGGDLSQIPAVVDAAKKLERQGAKAVVGGCGFFALYQQEVAKAVSVPVAMSNLLQVPLISQFIGKERRIGIITWSKRFLGEQHFNAVGWSSNDIPIVVGKGLDEFAVWKKQNFGPETVKSLEEAMIQIARDLLEENTDIGAFVFEGAALGFDRSIQKATGLPVYSLATLVRMMFSGICFI